MELEWQSFYTKAQEKHGSSEEALREAITQMVTSAVHRYSQMDKKELAQTLLTQLVTHLSEEKLLREEVLLFCIETLTHRTLLPQEKDLEELVVQREKIERKILQQNNAIKTSLKQLFNGIAATAKNLPDDAASLISEALREAKTHHVEALGILEETYEAALIATIEENRAIEPTARLIAGNLTSLSLMNGLLSRDRIRSICSVMLQKAVDVSEASPTHAKEILAGTLKGINDGLVKSIRTLKNQLRYAPEETRSSLAGDWEETVSMLLASEELLQDTINKTAAQSPEFIRQTLLKPETLADQLAELRLISLETVEMAKERLAFFAKEAASKSAELRMHLAEEAREVGTKAWKVARGILEGAYKGAKEAINKEDKEG